MANNSFRLFIFKRKSRENGGLMSNFKILYSGLIHVSTFDILLIRLFVLPSRINFSANSKKVSQNHLHHRKMSVSYALMHALRCKHRLVDTELYVGGVL